MVQWEEDTKSGFDKLVLNETSDAVVITTPEGKVVYWNRGAEAVFGYAGTEAIGCLLNDLIVPIDALEEERKRLYQTGETDDATFEAIRRKKDCSLVYLDISSKVIRNLQGEIEYILSSQKDVTNLKVLRDAKVVEEKYRDLLESTPDGIVMINVTGRIVLTNSQADRLFGYQRGALIGRPIEVLLPLRYRDGHVAHRSKYFSHSSAWSMGAGLELRGLRQDGSEFPVEISFSPLKTTEGTLVTGAIRDVTERKSAEEVLRQSEERFRLLVDAVQDYAILMLNPEGQVVSWNQGAQRIKGYKSDEIIGKHFSCFYPPEAIAVVLPISMAGDTV